MPTIFPKTWRTPCKVRDRPDGRNACFLARGDLIRCYPNFLLRDLRQALICVRHWARSRKIERFQLGDLKSCCFDEFVNLAIEMAAASDSLPDWGNSILPDDDSGVGGAAVLDENQTATGF